MEEKRSINQKDPFRIFDRKFDEPVNGFSQVPICASSIIVFLNWEMKLYLGVAPDFLWFLLKVIVEKLRITFKNRIDVPGDLDFKRNDRSFN